MFEPNFSDSLLVKEMKKTRILMNKAVFFYLLVVKISKMVMHKFWYDYLKLKNREKEKLSWINIDKTALKST